MNALARWFSTRKGRLTLWICLAAAAGAATAYTRCPQVMPQTAIHSLPCVTLPARGQRVLVISPHPDDETIGAGGYICKAVRRGARVRIILVTNGNKHHLESTRYREFRAAAKTLGAKEGDLIFLNYPDGKLRLVSRAALYHALRHEIESFDPDILIYPHPGDKHPDHAVSGQVTENVLQHLAGPRVAYRYLVHHWCFPRPKKYSPKLYLLPPVKMVNPSNDWRRFMLDERTENTKRKALFLYRTQLRVPFLRSLLLSSVRRNELFAVSPRSDLGEEKGTARPSPDLGAGRGHR
jgi:LmbE family N-acetylglucosaminyl deacetylase